MFYIHYFGSERITLQVFRAVHFIDQEIGHRCWFQTGRFRNFPVQLRYAVICVVIYLILVEITAVVVVIIII